MTLTRAALRPVVVQIQRHEPAPLRVSKSVLITEALVNVRIPRPARLVATPSPFDLRRKKP